MEQKTIGIACDHAGYQLKEFMTGYLGSLGYDVLDYGCHSEESCDYPDFAHELAKGIEDGDCTRGIAVCGSGNGIAMTLNKHQSIRAAICWQSEIASLASQHNNANVCVLPGRFIDNTTAASIVDSFLDTPFEGGRHQARLDKMPVR